MMYHAHLMLATTRRIIEQLLHDKRTIILMFLAPTLLISLLWWMFSDNEKMFNIIGPALIGIFPFTVMFLVASITTLRERVTGTMERLMAMPIGKFDIIFGYALAFGLFGAIQSLLTSSIAIFWLGLDVVGPQWFFVLVALISTLLGVSLGLFVSAFAKTEFQAIQFLPVFIFPQIIVCGLFIPIAQLPDLLQSIAWWMPLTHLVEALNGVTKHVEVTEDMWRNLLVVCVFIVVALAFAGLTLRRKTK